MCVCVRACVFVCVCVCVTHTDKTNVCHTQREREREREREARPRTLTQCCCTVASTKQHIQVVKLLRGRPRLLAHDSVLIGQRHAVFSVEDEVVTEVSVRDTMTNVVRVCTRTEVCLCLGHTCHMLRVSRCLRLWSLTHGAVPTTQPLQEHHALTSITRAPPGTRSERARPKWRPIAAHIAVSIGL